MTQPDPFLRLHLPSSTTGLLSTALALAAAGLPVLPLREGKLPFGNCPVCAHGACGGRPNMKAAGPCQCPAPCHGWAAATADGHRITSPPWAVAWRHAAAIGYHPADAGLTVVDLDSAPAVRWARTCLPPTRTVSTTRGAHWIYQGAMPSANAVRPGVDIKSRMAYTRWLGPGTGHMSALPPAVLRLAARKEEATPGGRVASSSPQRAVWDRSVASGCRHTDGYVRTGLDRGLAMVRARTECGAGSQAFGVAKFLAAQHTRCPGPCGLDAIAQEITHATMEVGVPEAYARRAVTNGLAAALPGRAAA